MDTEKLICVLSNQDVASDEFVCIPYKSLMINVCEFKEEGNNTYLRKIAQSEVGEDYTIRQLFDKAKENMRYVFDYSIEPLINVLINRMKREGAPEALIEAMELESKKNPLFIVTNQYCQFGASAILFDEVLYDFWEKIGSDYYIIPSSIHEVLIVPYGYADPENLTELLVTVNSDEKSVPAGDKLSDYLFIYRGAIHELQRY